METARIAELLEPYLAQPAPASASHGRIFLEPKQLKYISIYIDILLHWNARINLTAVREPEEIVRRHFGESLFAARYLFPQVNDQPSLQIVDVGSGAGFPGFPMKLWVPQSRVTLIEANHKKATFLREVIRAITLMDIDVFAGRAEDYKGTLGDVVTLRAVEKFEAILEIVTGLVAPGGRLALLIGESQRQKAKDLKSSLQWSEAVSLPGSHNRVLLVGIANRIEKESE